MPEKWSISRLSEETGLDRRTVKRVLGDTSPIDSDGKTDWHNLCDFIAAYRLYIVGKTSGGNLEAEKTRLTAAQADIAQVQRAKVRNEVIDVEAAFLLFSNIAIPIRRVIELSSLSNQEKDRVFDQLSGINRESIIQATMEQANDADEADGAQPGAVPEAGETLSQPMV